jgi:hypothetical protein
LHVALAAMSSALNGAAMLGSLAGIPFVRVDAVEHPAQVATAQRQLAIQTKTIGGGLNLAGIGGADRGQKFECRIAAFIKFMSPKCSNSNGL